MSALVISGDTSGAITLQSPAVAGTNTVNFGANTGTAILDANTPAFRNRIINGAMTIDARNAGASVTPNNSYTLDRWLYENTQTGKVTVEQTVAGVAAPTGFTDYLAVTSSSAYSVLTGDTFLLTTRIEGYNVADLAFGTASASTITLSFWVRSSLTGTFGGSFGNASANRSYAFSYTINAANTWEQKTVTIAGDTSGTWNTTTGRGLSVTFGLGSGSTYTGTAGSWQSANLVQPTSTVSVVGTNGATFYITGVQLEKGSTATSFDYRPYGTELALCQRYYYQSWGSGGFTNTGNNFTGMPVPNTLSAAVGTGVFPVTMRANPTVTLYDNSGNSGKLSQPGLADNLISTAAAIGVNGFSGANKTTTSYTVSYAVSAGFIASIEL